MAAGCIFRSVFSNYSIVNSLCYKILNRRLKNQTLFCTVLPQCGAFFRAKKPTAEEAEKAAERATSHRPLKPDENTHTINYSLRGLKRTANLDTKRGYKPPMDVVQRIHTLTHPLIASKVTGEDWQSTLLADPKLKYQVISRLIREFDHDMPASVLTTTLTLRDVVRYFETPVRETSSYEDLTTLDLPKNLHIQLEYLRFNPETDTMFGGRTAFPGSDTVVTSIKYRRKYAGVKNTKDKPGYVNPYFGY